MAFYDSDHLHKFYEKLLKEKDEEIERLQEEIRANEEVNDALKIALGEKIKIEEFIEPSFSVARTVTASVTLAEELFYSNVSRFNIVVYTLDKLIRELMYKILTKKWDKTRIPVIQKLKAKDL